MVSDFKKCLFQFQIKALAEKKLIKPSIFFNQLKEHLRSHSQERVVGCPVCGGLFSNRSKFFDHCKRQAPPEELNFKCSYCNKFFALVSLSKYNDVKM